MSFALNLKRLRLQRGLTQIRLAELSGIAQPNLAAMEQARRQPTLATLHRLAEALESQPETLLSSQGSGMSRFLMDETCRYLVAGKNRPDKLDEQLWLDLQVTFRPKLKILQPTVKRPRLRISANAAQRRITARLGPDGFREITSRLEKVYAS
jgi:transcriptional regulator with XRE-family HTH domain